MKIPFPFFVCIFLMQASASYTQPFVFYLSDSINVISQDKKLEHAWAGGINSVQVNKLDINNDQVADLVLYDRSNDKVTTFINDANQWVYAPYYEANFPDINFWLLLRDYNGDGKKDLFTGTSAGIKVYRNNGFGQNGINWELIADPLRTLGFSSSNINLKVDITDVPAIIDLDNDGDLDILNVLPSLGGSIELHRNVGVERFGNADTLVLEKITDRWAGLVECGNCSDYFFDGGASCRTAAIKHAGSSLLLFDADGDGDKELLLGESDCEHLVYFENKGNATSVFFDTTQIGFPPSTSSEILFPAAFLEDIDFNDVQDLIVSPNLFANDALTEDFANSVRLYQRASDDDNFQLKSNSYLQDNMIEVGEGASPAVADEDGDGDLDLFVANRGLPNNGKFIATIYFFENIGTDKQPEFRLQNEDYLNLSELEFQELKLQFVDLDDDGKQDLSFTAFKLGDATRIRYLLNEAENSASNMIFNVANIQQLTLQLSRREEAHIIDVDKDGNLDVLVGKNDGELLYYKNEGNFNFGNAIRSFGGIGLDILRRELSIETIDLDGNGKLELITGDRSGKVTIYPDFQDNIEGDFEVIGDTIYNTNEMRFVDYSFGSGIFPVAFNNDLIIGTESGGLRYLRQSGGGIVSAIPERVTYNFQLYPNPTDDIINIEIPNRGKLRVYNMQGREVASFVKETTERLWTISLGKQLLEGMYIFSFESKASIYNKKVVLQK